MPARWLLIVNLVICTLAALCVAGLACLLGSGVWWLWGVVAFPLEFVALCVVQI